MKAPTKFEPIWNPKSRIFATQREGPSGELSSLTYSGLLVSTFGADKGVLRRIEILPKNQIKIIWEYQFSKEQFNEGHFGSLGDLFFLPGIKGGVIAIRMDTGERVWEIGYTDPLMYPPRCVEDKLGLAFQDRCWLLVNPMTGEVSHHEKAANESAFSQLARSGREFFATNYNNSVTYKNAKIDISTNIRVEAEYRKEKNCAIPPGSYPIQDWNTSDNQLELFGDKLVVYLKKEQERAIGILSLPSMEPFRLLPLGALEWTPHENYRVQELLAVRMRDESYLPSIFLVDASRGSLVAYLSNEKSHIFLSDHKIAWSGKL